MNIIFLTNEIFKYVCLVSASWEIRSNGTDTLSDKATPQEYQAVDELMGYIDLKNTVRGSSRVFEKECLQHDEAGLSSIFDKVLNDDISELRPNEIPPTAPRHEPKMSRTPMIAICPEDVTVASVVAAVAKLLPTSEARRAALMPPVIWLDKEMQMRLMRKSKSFPYSALARASRASSACRTVKGTSITDREPIFFDVSAL